ncbi:MAG: hypothetical protein J6K52_03405 [Clostridia bacterium]|nr:hypothetical protein [Clostridia bacterium]
MIYAENAVIQVKDSCHFDWVGQCPRCGHVEASWTRNAYISSGGYRTSSILGHKTCSKCKTRYEIKAYNVN